MKKDYKEIYSEIFIEKKEELIEVLEDYKKKGLPKGVGMYYEELKELFNAIAVGEWVYNKNAKDAKINFYLESNMQKEIFLKYNNDIYNISESLISPSFTSQALFAALISDNEDTVLELAKRIGNNEIEQEGEGRIFYPNLNMSLKNIILKEIKEASRYLERLKSIAEYKDMKYYNGYEKVLSAILEKDKETVQKELTKMLDNHKKIRDYKQTPNELLSLEVIALAKLANNYELNISLDCELAPKELIERHTIEYPVIDFVD